MHTHREFMRTGYYTNLFADYYTIGLESKYDWKIDLSAYVSCALGHSWSFRRLNRTNHGKQGLWGSGGVRWSITTRTRPRSVENLRLDKPPRADPCL